MKQPTRCFANYLFCSCQEAQIRHDANENHFPKYSCRKHPNFARKPLKKRRRRGSKFTKSFIFLGQKNQTLPENLEKRKRVKYFRKSACITKY